MISFRSYNALLESFKDAKKNWVYAGASAEEVDSVIKKFQELKDKNRIKDSLERDIGQWMKHPFETFKSFVQGKEKDSEQQTNYRGLDSEVFKIWDNEFSYCIVPKTYRASNKLGSSNWCIVYGQSYWKEYVEERGLTPYYIIFKEKADIIDAINDNGYDISAIAVIIDRYDELNSVWDNDDNQMRLDKVFEWDDGEEGYAETLVEVLERYGIDLDDYRTFKSRVHEEDPVPQEIDKWELEPYFEAKDHYGEIGSHEYESRYLNAYAELARYYEENQTEYPIDSETLEDYLKSISIGYTECQHLDISKLGDLIHRTPDLEEIKIIKDIYEDFVEFCEDIYREDEEYTYTLDY